MHRVGTALRAVCHIRDLTAGSESPPYLESPRTARGAVPTCDIGTSANRLARRGATVSFMHFIYLDESGDPGLTNSPTKYYILAGLSVHHADWHRVDERLRTFRQWAKDIDGLDPAHEIHAAEFLGAANMHCGLRREQRLLIIRRLIGNLSQSPELRFFGWITNKDLADPLQRVGRRSMADLEAWLNMGQFRESRHLFIIHDEMHQQPSAWHHDHYTCIIGRPVAMSSRESRQLQIADLVAYLLKQSLQPNRYLKEQGAQNMVKRLNELSLGWIDV